MTAVTSTQDTLKRQAGEEAAREVRSGQVVGLGTGSTVEWTLRELARLVKEDGLDIVGIPTSERSHRLAVDLGIPLTTLDEDPRVDITIDGADEVDPMFDLVKGGGGALTREKIVAKASKREVIVVDPSKMVQRLADAFPLPVEVVPMAVPTVHLELETMGFEVVRRKTVTGEPYRTDNQMHILSCRFPGGIHHKDAMEREINMLPGVLENGLFLGICNSLVVGTEDGPRRLKPGEWL